MEEGNMPTINIFYGIRIFMYQTSKEHNPPHIHAEYGEHHASFRISDGALIRGEFPNRATAMVKEFIEKYKDELIQMWESGNYYKLEGIN